MFSEILMVVFVCYASSVATAPSSSRAAAVDEKGLETTIDNFLDGYFEEHIRQQVHDVLEEFSKDPVPDFDDADADDDEGDEVGIYDRMQGDQPEVVHYGGHNFTAEQVAAMKERDRRDVDKRTRKEIWKGYLKDQILRHMGRGNNSSTSRPVEEATLTNLNISQIIPKILNTTLLDDDQITEKIRSFYPSCEAPSNTDQELWKDDDIMNLYFDVDYLSGNGNSNIATATLRLYRLPQNGTSKIGPKKDDCDNSDSVEEEKLLRVSVYWYTKFQKRRRVKRRLSDSKVVAETARWVELSVKPATKAWNRAGARNLGLGIVVEDQEGKALRADRYFKGASCTVGVSTPKPIPTIIRDASESDEIHSLFGRNSTTALHSDVYLLPSIDICFLEFPDNCTSANFNSARINACNLRKIHEENQRSAEKEKFERIASFSRMPSKRHIRHQRQFMANKRLSEGASDLEFDLRSRMSDSKVILTRDELPNIQNKFVNR
ncbi:uncharacterized protein LOC132706044 isoform X2 [Cylas formicarius]|uniref:uncharacterized protein LOC132706044 isoform X2 n=1 Tax=Cylas formicarius TaxID=197179 RepID=UPI002958CCCD|nr:uncharacterized protein LOC132706044 isoform X2 [Cylas formicarius]